MNGRVILGGLAACSAVALAINLSTPVGHASVLLGTPAAKATASVSDIHLMDTTSAQNWTMLMSNTLKTPNKKDLFIDVSLESGLMTRTLASSKNGAKQKSTAEACIKVKVLVDGQEAYPGEVVFARRRQELSATFQGLIASCFVIDPTTGNIVLDENCVEPEEVELVLETMNASSFRFVYPDCDTGEHSVQVLAEIDTIEESGTGEAEAYGLIGKGSVAVEEVRMVNGEIILN
jgi:hypothetical protein